MLIRCRPRVARFGLLGSIVGGALVTVAVGSAAAADPPAGCTTTGDVTTCVFAYTGEAQTWTVPPTLKSATFDLSGAAGGGYPDFPALAPGLGGRATATLPVAAGDSIQVDVGGQGSFGGFSIPDVGGGFNGGGDTCSGFGGGGASDIRIGGTALSDRALVAGGGGGTSANAAGDGNSIGGGGGGVAGLRGGDGGFSDSAGGGGGTQSAGGASGGDGAGPGTFGVGGDGPPYHGVCTVGGGGGGGWYGGGGGFGGAGGGGSGFGPADVVFETGVRSGDGLATISYVDVTAPIARLLAAATGIGPGKALSAKVRGIQDAVAANDAAGACAGLADFLALLEAQTGKKLTPAQAASLTTQEQAIEAILDC